MPESRVFLFGAGASKAEGGLLTSELLFESLRNPEVKGEYTSVVKAFLKDLFRIENAENIASVQQMPEFEELLTTVDIALLKQEEFSETWNKSALLSLREALIYCMARVLRIHLRSPGREDQYQKYHKAFIQTLLDEESTTCKGSFISLNYDILLDQAILNCYPRTDIDYGVSFRNIPEPRLEHRIKVLKLHGSLNWAFCPVCNSLQLSLSGKIADTIVTEKTPCSRDNAAQQPLLIPPTWLKVYDNAHLVKIWLDAEHTLREATTVFFIGYSLPESDFHVRYLLKKALYRSQNHPRLVVITSSRNPESSDLHKRYKRFFGEIEYHLIGFEEFSNNARNYLREPSQV
jgi:hypothetical protein